MLHAFYIHGLRIETRMVTRETTTISLDRSDTYERLEEFKYETRSRSFNAAVEKLLDEAGVEPSQGE